MSLWASTTEERFSGGQCAGSAILLSYLEVKKAEEMEYGGFEAAENLKCGIGRRLLVLANFSGILADCGGDHKGH